MRISLNVALIVTHCLIASGGLCAQSYSVSKPSTFSVREKTETPDGVLKQGDYSIRISDHLADRMIIEIRDQDGRVDQKFLGVPAKNLPSGPTEGPSLAAGVKGGSAMRGFAFSNGSVVEFVYLKNDAVALAKANGSAVLAVDPSSEGMAATKNMSQEDMKIVTLWLLTPKPVGPNDQKASIQAEKYQVPVPRGTQIAETQTPSAINATAAGASRSRPANISRLPKTASDLPLLMLLAFSFFATASSIRLWNVRSAKL